MLETPVTGRCGYLSLEVTRGDEESRIEPASERHHRVEREVRHGHVDRRETIFEGVRQPRLDVDSIRASVARGHLDSHRIRVEREHRLKSEPGRRDRQHARAATDVQQAAPVELDEQLEAESRRRVRAGAERASGCGPIPVSPATGTTSSRPSI